jgi:hypothetical protein
MVWPPFLSCLSDPFISRRRIRERIKRVVRANKSRLKNPPRKRGLRVAERPKRRYPALLSPSVENLQT